MLNEEKAVYERFNAQAMESDQRGDAGREREGKETHCGFAFSGECPVVYEQSGLSVADATKRLSQLAHGV